MVSSLGAVLPEQIGDYQLLEEIARGGMGVVFKARQISLGRTVAVKMILSGEFASPKDIHRFRREARTVAQLRHPNIVAIYEVGAYNGRDYFSMEWVEGRNLAELAQGKPLEPARAARYVKIIAEAVHYAHKQGVLHRDLKPPNVLIDENDQPPVTDFGLAKRLHEVGELTVSGQVLGTPNFMPPEQASGGGKNAGPQNDIYSIGALLYFLVTGREPFSSRTMEETLLAVQRLEPKSPREFELAAPTDLETVWLKCMEKDPRSRYESAQSVADELARFLRREPIRARPISRLERLARSCRRSPKVASLTISLVVTTAALLALIATTHRKPISASDVHLDKSSISAGPFPGARSNDPTSTSNISQELSSTIVEIDEKTHAMRRLDQGMGVAVDAKNNHVWIATLESGSVAVYGGATDVRLTNIVLGFKPMALAVDPVGRIVVVAAQGGSGDDPLWAINADTYAVMTGRIHSRGVLSQPLIFDPESGRFYFATDSSAQHLQAPLFEPETNGFGRVIAVDPDAHLIFARPSFERIQIIDSKADTIVTNVTLPFSGGSWLNGVDTILHRLYVPDTESNQILVFDDRTGEKIETLVLQPHGRPVTRVLGVAVDGLQHRVYAIGATDEIQGYYLCTLENGQQTSFTIPASQGPVISPALHKIFIIAGFRDGGFSR